MPYEKVDKPATWKEGGNTALFSFLSANLKYPVVCQEKGVQGVVLVVFVVEKDGSIAALIKDKPVRSFFVVPITFRLKK